MPVLIRGIFSGGGGNITLDDCTNISVTSRSDGVEIKWKDPEDIIFNGQVTARWTGTKLVRKEGSYPKNDKDGVLVLDCKVRNQHSAVAFKDTGVKMDVTYYYCLFPYTEKAVTMSDNNRFTGKRISILPVLKDNSWEQISVASQSGIAQNIWKIGDEIDVELTGLLNETITLQIWDFNHFQKTDKSGNAGILFGAKNLLKDKKQMNSSKTALGGWNDSEMRKVVMNNIYNSMPTDLKKNIKEVITEANEGEPNSAKPKTCNDRVFIPGNTEIGSSWQNADGIQKKIPIFTDNTSRLKKLNDGSGTSWSWWTRSPTREGGGYFCAVERNGAAFGSGSATDIYNGVCFCFNV